LRRKKAFAKIGILEKGMARPMKKPIFWNTLAIYLLLYNNILIVISLVLALKAVVAGTAVFDVAVWYQILIFGVYLVMIAGLITGGAKGYILGILFVPFIFLNYFYPPLMVQFFPKTIMLAFRIVELGAFGYFLLAPESRAYFRECRKK
jgi:F0F1-type ATP synthase membrane subunit a